MDLLGHCWTLMGAPLGRVNVVDGPSISSPEQPDGIGVEVRVVPAWSASQLATAVADQDAEIVRLRAALAEIAADPDGFWGGAAVIARRALARGR